MAQMLLDSISWKTYECLLNDLESKSAPRITYDRGRLEIMSPLIEHEEVNRALAVIVDRLAEEWGIRYRNLGSTTFRRADAERGFEPDTCFYIQNVSRIGNRRTLDLAAGDPPPDLVIEVDVTHPSLEKLPIMAALGVPEVWHVVNEQVEIILLTEGEYQAQTSSVALPKLTVTALNALLAQNRTLDSLAWVQTIRAWAQQNP